MTQGDARARLVSLAGRLFPGDRRVWIAGGGVLGVVLAALLVALLTPREYYTGTNSVAPREGDLIVPANATLCVRRVRLPARTGAVRIGIDTQSHPRPGLRLTAYLQRGGVVHGYLPASPTSSLQFVDIPIPTTPASPAFALARLCYQPVGGYVVSLGRSTLQSNDLAPLLDGKPVPVRVGLAFMPPGHRHRSILSHVGEMLHRAALFRPRLVGEWTYWLLLFGIFPALAYGALRLMAMAGVTRRRRVPLAAALGLLAFGNAASWALITPPFQSPDEPEHFAYAQYLAETGHAIDRNPGARPPYSGQEGFGLEAIRETSVIERSDARPPWYSSDEKTWRARTNRVKPGRDTGGGFHPATNIQSPAYYAMLAPAYLLVEHNSVFTQLTAVRLVSALLGALTVVLAFLAVRELLPDRRSLAVAAGLLVSFEPMFGFISGAVNNDNGVNVACALIVYLIVRSLRRGMTTPVAIALGGALVAAPVLKVTGYELYPPAVLALLLLTVRRHSRRDLIRLAVLLVSFAVFEAGWSELAGVVHRTTFTTPTGTASTDNVPASSNWRGFASWMVTVFSPFRPSFLANWTLVHWPAYHIYIQRGFAAFGWYAIQFPEWVYQVIVGVMFVVGAMGIAGLWRLRDALGRWWAETLFLLAVPVAVLAAVEAAYYPNGHLPIDGIAEQGRYAFPAIAAVATLIIGACCALGRRWAVSAAAALVGGLIGLSYASQWLTLSSFFT